MHSLLRAVRTAAFRRCVSLFRFHADSPHWMCGFCCCLLPPECLCVPVCLCGVVRQSLSVWLFLLAFGQGFVPMSPLFPRFAAFIPCVTHWRPSHHCFSE